MNCLYDFNDPKIRIGVETTWVLNKPLFIKKSTNTTTIFNNKNYQTHAKSIEKVFDKCNTSYSLLNVIEQQLRINNISCYRIYIDCGVIEICSKPLTTGKLSIWYENLHTLMYSLGFIESSKYDLYSQGGLHLNIDLPKNTLPYHGGGVRVKNIKYQNLLLHSNNIRNFYRNNPWINWVFYEPNEVGKSYFIETNLESICFYTNLPEVRGFGGRDFCARTRGRFIEFRGFGMPLNKSQFFKYVNFQICLINYLEGLTLSNQQLPLNKFNYTKISLDQAKNNVKGICKKIGYPLKWLNFTNLELRYAYNLPKSCLI